MKSRRSFLAFVATAFICSMSTISPAHAGGGGGNTLKVMAKQGGKYHSITRDEALKERIARSAALKEREAKKKKEESGE